MVVTLRIVTVIENRSLNINLTSVRVRSVEDFFGSFTVGNTASFFAVAV